MVRVELEVVFRRHVFLFVAPRPFSVHEPSNRRSKTLGTARETFTAWLVAACAEPDFPASSLLSSQSDLRQRRYYGVAGS